MTITTLPERVALAGTLRSITPGADVVTAITESGLMWGTETRDLYLDGGQKLPSHVATVRVNPWEPEVTPLAVVGRIYVPISNLDAFLPLQALRDDDRISFVQGGMTKDGRHCFLLAELVASNRLLDVDEHKPFILARTSHDGTGALVITPWLSRLFCTNQIPLAGRRGTAIVRIQHSAAAGHRMTGMGSALDKMIGAIDRFDTDWRWLAHEPVSTHAIGMFLSRLFPIDPSMTDRMIENRQVARRTVESLLGSETNAPIAGSAASLFAAATEYDQWFRGKDARRREVRLLEGRSNAFMDRAWDLTLAVAGER